jgi:protein-S-isoprenylcysteine O-methyltransferase Ste14
LLLPGTVLVWVPTWLEIGNGGMVQPGMARWFGLTLLTVGVLGLLWCIWDFGRRGRGTLAPVDPPRFVVRGGLYGVVRNPMYLSVLTALVGETVLFGSYRLLGWAVSVAVTVHFFVVAYEEPRLREQFGAAYEEYCGDVSRWMPRLVRRDRRRHPTSP